MFRIFGTELNITPLKIILPIGISFYTFQGISYLTDVYRKNFKPSDNLLSFSIFITFFPQLVAGPIERASDLLPQINNKRIFNYNQAITGLKLIALGLFEKIVIADNCAVFVNAIFDDYASESGSTLFFGAVLFSFQIYGDFCGYSHIAIGSANLLGFNLTKNFNYPYLAQNIADFWRRWHISFSYWLRDYIYFPLGGSKQGEYRKIKNLTIVFLISGIWHGADWTFVIYGAIHALLYIIFIYYRKWTRNIRVFSSKLTDTLYDFIAIVSTFVILTIARVFFRAESYSESMSYLKRMLSESLFEKPNISRFFIVSLFGFLILEWLQKDKEHLLDLSDIKSKILRHLIYLGVVFMIFFYSSNNQSFIYFQF
ncbi:MAG: MBOAT family O-acyltransferase [Flavobacteriaceae bacterium]